MARQEYVSAILAPKTPLELETALADTNSPLFKEFETAKLAALLEKKILDELTIDQITECLAEKKREETSFLEQQVQSALRQEKENADRLFDKLASERERALLQNPSLERIEKQLDQLESYISTLNHRLSELKTHEKTLEETLKVARADNEKKWTQLQDKTGAELARQLTKEEYIDTRGKANPLTQDDIAHIKKEIKAPSQDRMNEINPNLAVGLPLKDEKAYIERAKAMEAMQHAMSMIKTVHILSQRKEPAKVSPTGAGFKKLMRDNHAITHKVHQTHLMFDNEGIALRVKALREAAQRRDIAIQITFVVNSLDAAEKQKDALQAKKDEYAYQSPRPR